MLSWALKHLHRILDDVWVWIRAWAGCKAGVRWYPCPRRAVVSTRSHDENKEALKGVPCKPGSKGLRVGGGMLKGGSSE